MVGCRQPYQETERFNSFHTNLIYGDNITEKELDLKSSVKMNPPMNLTVNNDSGHELWLYWNNSRNHDCMESEVRHRTNNNEWTHVMFDRGLHDFSLPLPSQKRRYEFQVRTRVSEMCHMSKFWSEWSQPISWGPFIAPDLVTRVSRTSVWTPVLSVGGFLILLLLLLLLLHNERLRVILIPIVPTPAKNLAELLETHNGNVEEWLHISKELKEGFKPNFSERACSVREYTSQSESSAFITIDQ